MKFLIATVAALTMKSKAKADEDWGYYSWGWSAPTPVATKPTAGCNGKSYDTFLAQSKKNSFDGTASPNWASIMTNSAKTTCTWYDVKHNKSKCTSGNNANLCFWKD